MEPQCLGIGCNYDCGNCVNITNRTHPEPFIPEEEDE